MKNTLLKIIIPILLSLSLKATIYPIKIGTDYQSLYNLCPGDTLRFKGDSLNMMAYGSVTGYVYNSQTHLYDNFNIISFTNIATTYDHVLAVGDSCYSYNLSTPPPPLGIFYFKLNFNCLITSILKHAMESNFTVYPNPANDVINFQFSNTVEKRKIELYDTIGNLVLTKDTSSNNLSLTTDNLPNGIYFYVVKQNNIVLKQNMLVIIK